MPAKSENQRRAAGMALSAKRGKTDVSKLKGAAKDMYESMSSTDLEHFAAAKISEARTKGFSAFWNAFQKDSEMSENDTFEEQRSDVLAEQTPEPRIVEEAQPPPPPLPPPPQGAQEKQLDNMFNMTAPDTAHSNSVNNVQAGPQVVQSVSESKDILVGGMGDGKDPDVSEVQLDKGIETEMDEHTNNPAIAREIAVDHLSEFDNYYTALSEMENDLRADEGMTQDDKTKVAFVLGFAKECADRRVSAKELRTAVTVIQNMIPDIGMAFQKVSGELAAVAGTPDVKAQPSTALGSGALVEDNPSKAFMLNYAQREIKNKKLAKGGITPTASSVFLGEGNRRAIAGVSASR